MADNKIKKNKLSILICRYLFWILALAIMIMIFIFSSQDAGTSTKVSGGTIEVFARIFVPGFKNMSQIQKDTLIENMQHFARKTAHFTAYMGIGVMTAAAMRTYNIKLRYKLIIPAAIGLIYAATDEFHQGFTPGRSPQVSDVLLDFCGVLTGIGLVALICIIYMNIKKRRCKDNE